ncbi:histone-fold-containing protein [Pseudohyphozyma bogoriensis]|nr:histone-fold-containing protein [Pseudohyphozyma bogoriensis]
MSDNEDVAFGGSNDEDLGLPKATIAKLIQELLPPEFTCAKDAKDLMAECCKEFVLAISSEANEICEKDAKKTMLPEHILEALKALGFENMVDEISEVLSEHKELAKGEKQKKAKKMGGSGMTQEELLAAQEALFSASRAKFEAGGVEPS